MTSQCANGDVATCRTPTFPVDTHIHRLAQRWGLTKGKTVEQTEADLKVVFRPVVTALILSILIGLLKDFPMLAMPDSSS
jgi:endonuclease III